MLKIDILERESWRVTEEDSKEEKAGTEDGSCVKGSPVRKPVPFEGLVPE